MVDIASEIRDYIARNLLFTDDGFHYGDDASFLDEGIIDSVGVMDLVLFVEENYNIEVPDRDVTRDHFDSINKLVHYVQLRKTA